MTQNKVIISDQELKLASHYFRYHVLMYIDTLLFLQIYHLPNAWDTKWNAILEDHLVHARVLIEFLTREKRNHSDDVLAIDYFHDIPTKFDPFKDEFLTEQSKKIGGQLVHLTRKAIPELKSHQNWPILEIKDRLTPAIIKFLESVPETRLADRVRGDCQEYLAKLKTNNIPISLHAAT